MVDKEGVVSMWVWFILENCGVVNDRGGVVNKEGCGQHNKEGCG